jgi:hypothetical protein
MSYKDILQTVPTLQAASLVGNLAKKKKKRRLIGDATEIFVGVPLIQSSSQLIGGL